MAQKRVPVERMEAGFARQAVAVPNVDVYTRPESREEEIKLAGQTHLFDFLSSISPSIQKGLQAYDEVKAQQKADKELEYLYQNKDKVKDPTFVQGFSNRVGSLRYELAKQVGQQLAIEIGYQLNNDVSLALADNPDSSTWDITTYTANLQAAQAQALDKYIKANPEAAQIPGFSTSLGSLMTAQANQEMNNYRASYVAGIKEKHKESFSNTISRAVDLGQRGGTVPKDPRVLNDPSAGFKRNGWRGINKNYKGEDVTELTVDETIDGKKVYFPLVYKGISDEALKYILATPFEDLKQSKQGKDILTKARETALGLIAKGESPFAEDSGFYKGKGTSDLAIEIIQQQADNNKGYNDTLIETLATRYAYASTVKEQKFLERVFNELKTSTGAPLFNTTKGRKALFEARALQIKLSIEEDSAIEKKLTVGLSRIVSEFYTYWDGKGDIDQAAKNYFNSPAFKELKARYNISDSQAKVTLDKEIKNVSMNTRVTGAQQSTLVSIYANLVEENKNNTEAARRQFAALGSINGVNVSNLPKEVLENIYFQGEGVASGKAFDTATKDLKEYTKIAFPQAARLNDSYINQITTKAKNDLRPLDSTNPSVVYNTAKALGILELMQDGQGGYLRFSQLSDVTRKRIYGIVLKNYAETRAASSTANNPNNTLPPIKRLNPR